MDGGIQIGLIQLSAFINREAMMNGPVMILGFRFLWETSCGGEASA
jgi:hypothetical protein